MSEIQKKSLFFFLFPNACIFDVVKGTIISCKMSLKDIKKLFSQVLWIILVLQI